MAESELQQCAPPVRASPARRETADGPDPSAFRDPRLRRVRVHLEEHLERPLSLTRAAELAGLVPKYFSALFHAKVGMRYTRWTHLVRTERAKRYLAEREDLSIAAVACKVGYSELRTFERAFRLFNPVTARTFRKYLRLRSRGRPRGRTPTAREILHEGSLLREP
jgi:transcriptional regulator GlxA family with amidase domain